MKHPEIYLAGLLHGIGLWGKSINQSFEQYINYKIEDNYESIINQASQYALGRSNNEKKPPVQPQNLKSVFQIIQTGDHDDVKRKDFYFPLKTLSIKDEIFPKEDVSENIFAGHYDIFIKEAKKLPNQSLQSYNESLLALLQKYAWCVPVTDYCSLYEYTKMTASFAQCLFEYNRADNKLSDYCDINTGTINLPPTIYPFLFLSVELTGIQKFIYNINSNKAARALKGRSFFLNLLIDTVKTKIIHELGLSSAHVIYASGGKFYMLLPNTCCIVKGLEGIKQEIIKQLHDDRTIGDELYVCFGTQAFGMSYKEGYNFQYNLQNVGEDKTVSELWKKVGENSSVKKSLKYQHLLTANFEDFFTPQPNETNVNMEEVCALTGLFFENEDDKVDLEKLFQYYSTKQEPVNEDEENRKYVKKSVAEQVKIGKNLQTAEYIVTFVGDNYLPELEKLGDHTAPLGIGVHTLILSASDPYDWDTVKEIPFNKDYRYSIRHLNSFDSRLSPHSLNVLVKEFDSAIGWQFYGGNQQAKDSENEKLLKDFEALAEDNYLGILRMDVDGLGQIFIKGFPENEAGFSALATLSSQLDWFFSGYLNTIRNSDKYKKHVNILYSGGDDVFAVGKWDVLLDFAEEIRNEFRKFVCNREDISISAGIALVGAKFPILKAADMAGAYEEEAKLFSIRKAYGKDEAGIGCKFKTVQKNAICLFGIPVCWENEWKWVKEMKELLVKWIDTEQTQPQLSKAVLHKIMLFHHLNTKHTKNKKQNKRQDITWRWHAAYYIGRHRKQSNIEAMDFLQDLWMNNEYTNHNLGDRAITLLAVAARWAELELRVEIN